MTDKVQKIREKLERLKEETSIGLSEHENGVEQGRMEIINAISLFLDSLQEESVSEDLEKEVERWRKEKGAANIRYYECAKHFANWQKQQMMVNTTDATIGLPYENKDGGYTHLIDVSRPLPVGNNKIAIIFKED